MHCIKFIQRNHIPLNDVSFIYTIVIYFWFNLPYPPFLPPIRQAFRNSPASMERNASALIPASRPRKKMRTDAKIAVAEEPVQPMYFDMCPDAIENIIRCTSSRPSGEKWSSFIYSATVSSLCDVEGWMCELITQRFDEILIPRSNSVAATKRDIPFQIEMSGDKEFRLYLIGDDDDDGRHFHGPNMLKPFSQKIRNLDALVFDSIRPMQAAILLGLFGKQRQRVIALTDLTPPSA